MTDWTADDILAGKEPSDGTWSAEGQRRVREALADPETVSLVVVGRNGETFTHRINGGERTALSITANYTTEPPPEDWGWGGRSERWAPSWRETTWTVRSETSYRASDFQSQGG